MGEMSQRVLGLPWEPLLVGCARKPEKQDVTYKNKILIILKWNRSIVFRRVSAIHGATLIFAFVCVQKEKSWITLKW